MDHQAPRLKLSSETMFITTVTKINFTLNIDDFRENQAVHNIVT